MSALAPHDIITEPKKTVYNAPSSEKNTFNICLTNKGAHRIGWEVTTTNMQRIKVSPPWGVLDAKKTIMLTMMVYPFDYGTADTNNDRIVLEWQKAPEGSAMQFRHEWLKGDAGRKVRKFRFKDLVAATKT